MVPHSKYPAGYHVNPKDTINLAAQKNNVSLYYNGMYGDQELLQWYTEKYKEIVGKKPNMGKTCIRFKKGLTLLLVFSRNFSLRSKWMII